MDRACTSWSCKSFFPSLYLRPPRKRETSSSCPTEAPIATSPTPLTCYTRDTAPVQTATTRAYARLRHPFAASRCTPAPPLHHKTMKSVTPAPATSQHPQAPHTSPLHPRPAHPAVVTHAAPPPLRYPHVARYLLPNPHPPHFQRFFVSPPSLPLPRPF